MTHIHNKIGIRRYRDGKAKTIKIIGNGAKTVSSIKYEGVYLCLKTKTSASDNRGLEQNVLNNLHLEREKQIEEIIENTKSFALKNTQQTRN